MPASLVDGQGQRNSKTENELHFDSNQRINSTQQIESSYREILTLVVLYEEAKDGL